MKLRVLIADDESLSREKLRQLLRTDREIEVVAECSDGKEALKAIREKCPDLVFLDVKMPELDGFGVIDSLNGAGIPAIIFVTAHDQFAVRAFEANAVDYLLKPFDGERFNAAIQRVRHRLRRNGTPDNKLLAELLTTMESRVHRLQRIAIKSQGRVSMINVADVDWICAADNYAELHLGKNSYLLRMPISSLEDKLPKEQFVRISRSALVNVNRITEILPKAHGDLLILLQNGTSLPASRTFRRKLMQLLTKS